MKKNLAFAILTLFTLISCQKDNLIGEWNFNKVVETDDQKSASHFNDNFFKSGAVFAGNGNFLIIDDGTANPFQLNINQINQSYTRGPKNRVVYGTWLRENNDSEIKLTILSDIKDNEIIINELKNDGKQLKFEFKTIDFNESLETLAFYYTKENNVDISKSKYNYMSSELNAWRIPAKTSEGYKAINNRVKQSLEFALMYYKYCDNNELSLSLQYLKPLPLRFASNGIATSPNFDWESLFYDSDQAQMSYKIIRDAFRASPRVPSNLKNSFEIGIYVLEQLIANLEE